MKIVDKIIQIKADSMPPKTEFIEQEIKAQGIDPIRWALIDTKENTLILSVAGYEI